MCFETTIVPPLRVLVSDSSTNNVVFASLLWLAGHCYSLSWQCMYLELMSSIAHRASTYHTCRTQNAYMVMLALHDGPNALCGMKLVIMLGAAAANRFFKKNFRTIGAYINRWYHVWYHEQKQPACAAHSTGTDSVTSITCGGRHQQSSATQSHHPSREPGLCLEV